MTSHESPSAQFPNQEDRNTDFESFLRVGRANILRDAAESLNNLCQERSAFGYILGLRLTLRLVLLNSTR